MSSAFLYWKKKQKRDFIENPGRGERMVRIFVYLMVQSDMRALTNFEGGYIQRIIDSGKTYYQVALERANKLVFSDFGDMV